MKAITEEMHFEKTWFDEAKKQTPETVTNFINHIMNDYEHDYGTVCHAISACALAAACAANKAKGACGGITGFQAGFVMWDFVRNWNHPSNICGLRIVDYDNMLYPQCEEDYEKTISLHVWNSLQKEAKKRLEEREEAHTSIKEHWKKIADGEVPFGYKVKVFE